MRCHLTARFAAANLTVFLFFLALVCVENLQASTTDPKALVVPPDDPYEIRLVTFSPHDSLFAWFGHSALEVRNNLTGKAHMFNFGGFFFDMEHLLQFTFGKFVFWSFASESSQALIPYRRENRHIVYQTLNLTPQQKTEVRRLLLYHLRQENRFYVYDHFLDNCSTKIRDVIDQAMSGQLKQQSMQPVKPTFRDFVHRMMAGVPHLDFTTNFILNDSVDQAITDWDTMFLPDRLMAVIQKAKNPALGNIPLVAEKIEKNAGAGDFFFTTKANLVNTVVKEFVLGFFLLAIIGLSAIFYIKNHQLFSRLYPALVSVFSMIFGTLGLILFFMMCFTDHKDTYWNENILLLNPITFLLGIAGLAAVFGKLKKLFSWLSVVSGLTAFAAFGLKILPMFDQANGQQLRVLLPVLLVIGITGMVEIKNRNQPQSGNIKS